MKIAESLRSLSLYPLNPITVENICEECGLSAADTLSAETRASKSYKRATALVYLYISEAPQVTEAGASYNLTDDERQKLRAKAGGILASIGDDETSTGETYGYISENL